MRRLVPVFAVLAAFALGTFAFTWLALAAGDDRAAAESAIAELEKDPKTKELTADAVSHARTALERAHRMRVGGDEKHARLAEGLALEWAQVGQTLARAADVEVKAKDARQAALDAGARVDRERAMVEQQLAENGRLQAELAKSDDAGAGAGSASTPKQPRPATHDAGAAQGVKHGH
jgi:hypothetical protein